MASKTLCRLCAVQTQKSFNIFDPAPEKSNLLDKIKECLRIQITPEDELPKDVCYDCFVKVETFFSYYNSCQLAQTSLTEICKKKNLNDGFTLTELSLSDKEPEFYVLQGFKLDDKGELECDVECLLLENKGLSEKTTSVAFPPPDEPRVIDTESSTDVISLDQLDPDSLKNIQTSRTDSQDERSDHEDDIFDFDNSSQPPTTKKLFENYIWKCTDCSKEFPSMPQLKQHFKEVHDRPPSFKCMKCTKVYDRYRSFARHVKLHANKKNYSCEICGKCFAQKAVLQAHSTVHSEERPHVCSQCGKAFKQFSSLYLHSKCHLPEQAKPKYPCSICLKLFSSKHSLETHMRIHTGEKNFICDVCGKRFVSKGSLDYHMLAHNDAKPHSCQTCGKCFKTARLLAKHSTIHTGVKPHQCDVCGKQFRERGALKEHNRIHTGALPYSCEYCGKSFRFKGILTVHIRQHTGERPYSCSECRREFTNWANYNKHMKRRHKGINPSDRNGGPPPTRIDPEQPTLGGGFLDIPPPPAYAEAAPPQPPPPPYKLPLVSPEEELFRVQGSPFPSSPPLHVSYYIHPVHGLLPRTDHL